MSIIFFKLFPNGPNVPSNIAEWGQPVHCIILFN